MIYYLLLFSIFNFLLFMISYRMDMEFKSKKYIFKKIRLKKNIKKLFFYNKNEGEILIITLILQLIVYVFIPISIILSVIFAIYEHLFIRDFDRIFGIAFYLSISFLGIIFIILYLIDKKVR